MSKKFCIETSSTGKQQFVKLKRSRSHGHSHDHHRGHHRHHHHHDHHDYCHEYYRVSREEWNVLKERERMLDENNRALVDENKCLQADLAAAQAEVHRLQNCVIPELQAQNNTLYTDNQSLRRSIENAAEQAAKHTAEMEKLQCKVGKLEKEIKETKQENCDLRYRIRHMTKQSDQGCSRRVSDHLSEARYWRSRFEDLERRHGEMLDTLELRTERMEAYEEILKRRRII